MIILVKYGPGLANQAVKGAVICLLSNRHRTIRMQHILPEKRPIQCTTAAFCNPTDLSK